eukprot:TRINITY_DN92189_c0_g1_i1.p1 TRINITY_DN92189_c0_g1~~TRINITY_DN92189_c0_g1_i1.p1  ORF type:complete len:1429 (-),score=418.90 TRINITY_DN92189_c0_g1_i1:335-4621(-)
MDLAIFDDAKVSRGVQMLDGTATIISAEGKVSKRSKAELLPRKEPDVIPAGLEIGRRLLVVVKPEVAKDEEQDSDSDSDCSSPGDGKPKSNHPGLQPKVRVVDHGGAQKEAIRRFFEAQVLLRSYEEQLEKKEQTIGKLSEHVELLVNRYEGPMTNAVPDLGIHLPSRGAAAEEGVGSAATGGVAAAEGAGDGEAVLEPKFGKMPGWIQRDELSRTLAGDHCTQLMNMFLVEGEGIKAHKVQEVLMRCGADFAIRWGASPDNALRKQLQKAEAKCIRIQKDALTETSMLRQHVKRLEEQYKELQTRVRQYFQDPTKDVQRRKSVAPGGHPGGGGGSLGRTTSTSGIAGKSGGGRAGGGLTSLSPALVQRRHKRRNAVVSTQPPAAMSKAAKDAIARAVESGKSVLEAAKAAAEAVRAAGGLSQEVSRAVAQAAAEIAKKLGQPATDAVKQAAEAAKAAGASQAELNLSVIAAAAEMAKAQGLSESEAARAAADAIKSVGGSPQDIEEVTEAVQDILAPDDDGPVPSSPPRGGAVPPDLNLGMDDLSGLKPQQGNVPLWEDDTLALAIGEEEIKAIDNELFEPLNSWDPDTRELLIDCVNEKVRRILAMDPKSYEGLPPFGLRLGNDEGGGKDTVLKELQSQVFMLKEKVEELQQENDGLRDELGRAGNRDDRPRRPPPMQAPSAASLKRDKEPEEAAIPASTASRRERSKDFDWNEFAGGSDDEKKPSEDMVPVTQVQKMIKNAVQPVKDQLADVERKLYDAEKEAKAAQDALAKAQADGEPQQKRKASKEAPTPTASPTADRRCKSCGADLACPSCHGDQFGAGGVKRRGPKGEPVEKEEKAGKPKKAKADDDGGGGKKKGGGRAGRVDDDGDEPVEAPREDGSPSAGGDDGQPEAVKDEDLSGLDLEEQVRQLTKKIANTRNTVMSYEKILFKVCSQINRTLSLKPTQAGMVKVQDLLGKLGMGKEDEPEKFVQALNGFEQWASVVIQAVKDLASSDKLAETVAATSAIAAPPPTQPQAEVRPRGGFAPPPQPVAAEKPQAAAPVAEAPAGDSAAEKALTKEVLALTETVAAQQNEISKLLLLVDEMRDRMEKIQDMAGTLGGDATKSVQSIMERVGLKEMMQASSPPKLKGVFQRLYQDAVQRIQRLGLIQERMIMANHAYSTVIDAMSDGSELDPSQVLNSSPDLQRLNKTAGAALQGMWYHTDFLFRHACDYAMRQGVEACQSVPPTQTASMLEDGEQLILNDSPDAAAGRRPDRLPGRRGDRPPKKHLPGAVGHGNDAKAFWHPMPGGISGARSPRSLRKQSLQDATHTSFTAYVAAVKDARGELRHDEWPNCPRARPASGDRRQKDSALVRDGGKLDSMLGMPGKGKGFASSQSLPALPKVSPSRSQLWQASDAATTAGFDSAPASSPPLSKTSAFDMRRS